MSEEANLIESAVSEMAHFDQVAVLEAPVLDDKDDDLGERVEDVARIEKPWYACRARYEPQERVGRTGAAAQRR